ncbi:G5 and 3D domain-containing protein [Alkalihalobacillus sp. CinArs1]|uniref:G5 and 3D domain-containing protein n=1 Tax=Alkalihalobacillus sp. CinArs1 TaxID=2995314 RepID=UPI0022DDBF2F|nr:G5 and 3D domain-containing protein [Alkalihalobacillus sp. CinArs1]
MKTKMQSFSANTGKKIFMALLSVVVLGLVSGFIVFETTKASVTLVLDGEEKLVKTHANTVGDVLKEQEVDVGEYDYVNRDLSAELTRGNRIIWKPAMEVTIKVNGKEERVWTTKDTVKELLAEEKINLSEHDQLSVSMGSELKKDMVISITEAFQVNVNDGGKQTDVWTTSTTVADFLEQQNIELGELDRVEPGKETKLKSRSDINVVRVEKVTDVVEESIDFTTVTKNDSSMQKGKEKVINSGKNGKEKKHYEVVLENGKEVSRELVKTEVVEKSSDRVVAVGTQVIKQTAAKKKTAKTASTTKKKSTSSSKPSSGKVLYVSSTAYTANCSGCSGITATGFNLKSNPGAKVIAVDPSVIPLGSKVHVEGYGTAIAADTGGAIKGNKIDVFFSSKSAAYAWGRKSVKITILN